MPKKYNKDIVGYDNDVSFYEENGKTFAKLTSEGETKIIPVDKIVRSDNFADMIISGNTVYSPEGGEFNIPPSIFNKYSINPNTIVKHDDFNNQIFNVYEFTPEEIAATQKGVTSLGPKPGTEGWDAIHGTNTARKDWNGSPNSGLGSGSHNQEFPNGGSGQNLRDKGYPSSMDGNGSPNSGLGSGLHDQEFSDGRGIAREDAFVTTDANGNHYQFVKSGNEYMIVDSDDPSQIGKTMSYEEAINFSGTSSTNSGEASGENVTSNGGNNTSNNGGDNDSSKEEIQGGGEASGENVTSNGGNNTSNNGGDNTPVEHPDYLPRSYYSKADGYSSVNIENLGRDRTYQDVDTLQHDNQMHHSHITQTNRGYLPGAVVQLADNPYLDKISSGNILGNTDKSTFSQYDYVATYAATGKYNVEDLFKTVEALETQDVSFAQHPESYWNNKFDEILSEAGDQVFGTTASKLESEVGQLKQDFTNLHNQLTEWAGSSNDAVQEAIQCILGKFECTMGNIDSVLKPTCEAFDRLKTNLKTLKEMNNTLNGGVEKGSDPKPGSLEGDMKKLKDELGEVGKAGDTLYGQLKELQESLEELKDAQTKAQQEYDTIAAQTCPSYTISVPEYNDSDNPNKITGYHDETDSAAVAAWEAEHARSLAAAESALNSAKEAVTAKEAEIETKNAEIEKKQAEIEAKDKEIEEHKQKMDKVLKDVLKDYFMIKNTVQTVKSFSQYFNGKSEQSKWVQQLHSQDTRAVLHYHDLIVDDFEDYVSMPVITPLSGHYEYSEEEGRYVVVPYEVGDVLVHDDAHGYVYAVTEAWDPLKGTLKVACFDKDGNQIDKDLTIWDQREIVPIKWVREYDPEIYNEYPDHFDINPTPPPTSPEEIIIKTTPGTTPGPGPGPGPHPTPTPTPTHIVTPTVTPDVTPDTTPDGPTYSTGSPLGGGPGSVDPTSFGPYGGEVYGTEGPFVPGSPHTGLDAVYTGDSTNSSSGFGALAGLAAGAAGLGLTGLMKDRNKEEDEEEKEKDSSEEKSE